MDNQKKTLVVLSGSGISAESGMSTFRGGDGLWDHVPVSEICTPEGWMRNPIRVNEFYNNLRAKLETVYPNEAHHILAQLQEEYDVRIITQNVDNLHERAGSLNVLHLHGELTKVRPVGTYTDEDGFSLAQVRDIGYKPIAPGQTGGPRNTLLRPHIVWFGEAVPNLSEAAGIVSQADIMLIIGTSLQVYPAASLHRYAPDGCPIFLIDPDDVPLAALHSVTHIKDVATSGMRKFREIHFGKS